MKNIYVIENFDIDIDMLLSEYDANIKDLLKEIRRPQQSNILIQKKFETIHHSGQRHEVLSKMPYTQKIAERVYELFKYNNMTYRIVMPNTCYSWHIDPNYTTYHIPLITNEGCHFVYKNESHIMPVGPLYKVNNGIPHTFVNAGKNERLHLTFLKL